MFIQIYDYIFVIKTISKAPKRTSGLYCFNNFEFYSDSAGNLTGALAACASIYSAGRAVNDCLNSLNIGLPSSVRTSV